MIKVMSVNLTQRLPKWGAQWLKAFIMKNYHVFFVKKKKHYIPIQLLDNDIIPFLVSWFEVNARFQPELLKGLQDDTYSI